MNKKILPFILALGITGIFLYEVLIFPSTFNLLPYFIHESLWKGQSGESTFVRIFDIICGIILFLIAYKIFVRMFRPAKN